MPVAALCASHSPIMDYTAPSPIIAKELDACFQKVKAWVEDYDPELVIVFGPDHYNSFFYRLMPSFCIGLAAEAIGDWKTPAGEFAVASDAATALIEAVHGAGVDAAYSHHMMVDHGATQIIDALFDFENLPPLVPIFINCAAPPLPPLPRVLALADAVSDFAASRNQRVLVLGSGGLSHDPPIPRLADAPAPVRERLIEGGTLSVEARNERQQRVLDDATKQLEGTSTSTPLNPTWDQAFLDNLVASNFDDIVAMDDQSITNLGGCGGHEIRCWIAAVRAATRAGANRSTVHFYHPIAEWISGFGVLTME